MRVLTTPFVGTLNLWVRKHSASDYVFYIEDESTRRYSAFAIAQADTTYEFGKLSIDCSLTLTEGRFYNVFIFPQDGSVVDQTGTTESWWDNFLTLVSEGKIESDIVRQRVLCTNQTDLQKYTMLEGAVTERSTAANNFIKY